MNKILRIYTAVIVLMMISFVSAIAFVIMDTQWSINRTTHVYTYIPHKSIPIAPTIDDYVDITPRQYAPVIEDIRP